MAAGEFAEPIYKLLDDLGGDSEELVLGELIAYLSGDSIRDFVEDFRRHNKVVEETADSIDDIGYEDFHLCMDCQESYDIDKPHACSDNEVVKETIFFSSLIPEC